MNIRPATLGAMVVIVLVGFSIGAWLAIRTRGADQQTQSVTVASTTVAAPPARTLAPRPVRTLAPVAAPTPTALPTAVSITTIPPAPKPAATEHALPAAAPSAASAAAATTSAEQGSWQIDEANVQVGTIRWVGDAEPARGNTLAFNVHKQSVAGRAATRCERQTGLHAEFSLGAMAQTVPYREVNCDGVVSTGEIRVTSFSGNSGSFTGSFWRNGTNLGEFTARKL